MKTHLLFNLKFYPIFLVQFSSAFSDSFLKYSLALLILQQITSPDGAALVTVASVVAIAPFLLLSGLGGELADRYDKAWLTQHLSYARMMVALLAAGGFAWGSITVLFVALAGFGIISALFGPIKYGILPDHLTAEQLPAGNALIEGSTFIAILLGSIGGSLVAGTPGLFAPLVIGGAALGALAARLVPSTGEADAGLMVERNIFRSTYALLADLRGDRSLWHLSVMVSLFWLIGAVVLSLLPPLITRDLGGPDLALSLSLALFVTAIALGSGLGAALAAGRRLLAPAPVAGLAIACAAGDLALTLTLAGPAGPSASVIDFLARPVIWHVAGDLAALAIAGGAFIVSVFTAAQRWAPAEKRGRIVGAINGLSAAFMVGGGILCTVLQKAGVPMSGLFAVIGLGSLGMSLWIFHIIPTIPPPPDWAD